MKKAFFTCLGIVVVGVISIGIYMYDSKTSKPIKKYEIPEIERTNNFNIDLIKATKKDTNYLVSPYSIEIALNMLKEGANNNTKKEIESVISTRKINDISIKDRVKVANALFIKDEYKEKVKNSFSSALENNYNSNILYDKFKTPDVINNWVDKNTNGMIKKVIDEIDSDFAVGLANALAIDVEWKSSFECENTHKEKFTKLDDTTMNVEMMYNSYKSEGYKYLKDDDATGVILPYKSYNSETGKTNYDAESNLEFVGILPNESVSTYIDNLTEDKLNNLFISAKEASSNYEIELSLPRFKYSYDVNNFKEVLMAMGIKDAFDSSKADFTKIMNKNDMKDNLYISDAIHKTYIDLNENGTKAAAVTYFGLKDSAALIREEPEIVKIEFNKPFIYMIRDSKTKEILFFGVVYEPTKWTKSTCK